MSLRRSSAVVLVSAAVVLLLSGCGVSFLQTSGTSASHGASASPKVTFDGTLTFSAVEGATDVSVTTPVSVKAASATLKSVTLTGPSGEVQGTLADTGLSWLAGALLLPDTDYALAGAAVDNAGHTLNFHEAFHSAKLTKNQQTYPTILPADGSTVGIAMPVIVHFDVAVKDHAAFEKALSVTTTPAQAGAWRWVSNNEVHWRPQNYWLAGTTVTVAANIQNVAAGGGIFGQVNKQATIHIGRAQVLKVDAVSDQLNVVQGGSVIKTIPITTGKQPDFTTRSGVKVIMEKFPTIDMNSATIGIDPAAPQGYDLKNVQFAMRLTNSGEFLHAAPWSVASQGHANVSHGCTGMSVENAQWLFQNSIVGDPVEYTGTNRPMTATNGWGDWNIPFASYAN